VEFEQGLRLERPTFDRASEGRACILEVRGGRRSGKRALAMGWRKEGIWVVEEGSDVGSGGGKGCGWRTFAKEQKED
jgi:hypothetical protein